MFKNIKMEKVLQSIICTVTVKVTALKNFVVTRTKPQFSVLKAVNSKIKCNKNYMEFVG